MPSEASCYSMFSPTQGPEWVIYLGEVVWSLKIDTNQKIVKKSFNLDKYTS